MAKYKLNENQQLAVDNIEGPVMVIAGPGTGKTQILSNRIEKIIELTDTSPYNILCLTFTDAGVVAMKKRLIESLGPIAHHLNIFTFHSFCTKVINENPDLIGIKDLEPSSAIETTMIIRQIIDELPERHSLRRVSNSPYFDEGALSDLFQTLKMEDLSDISQLEAKTLAYIDSLPHREDYQYKRKYKEFKAGDIKAAMVDEETKRMNRLIDAAKLLSIYNKKLRSNKLYDFADMLTYVTKAFEKYEWMLRRYQEQFLYVLVDEFQDTNGTQFGLIKHLVSYWGKTANIFTVGDDDQCLYEFQGARLENLTNFESNYPEIVKIQLDVNYRSNQKILDAADSVIVNNTERLIANKSFKANHKKGDGVSSFVFNSKEEEYAYVIEQATEKLKEGSVAIIYSKHKQVQPIIDAMSSLGLPYTAKKRQNALYDPIIKCVLTMMLYFENPIKYDALLYEILSYPFMNITPFQSAELFQKKRVHNAKPDNEFKILLQFMEESDYPIKEVIETGISYMPISTPHLFYKWLIHNSGMLDFFKEEDYGLSILKTFSDFIDQLQAKNPKLTTLELIGTVQAMQENKIDLPVQEIVSQGGINIVSSHGSKGLEFDSVFMIDCTDNWEPGKGYHHKFKFPDTITLSGENSSLESSRRAFYVAMTRAEKNLVMTYSKKQADKDKNASQFLIESGIESLPLTVNKSKVSEFVIESLRGSNGGIVAKINDQYIAENIEGFVLSFSAMSTYQKCPIAFYYKYVLKVPAIEKAHLTYGSAIHYALEMFYRDMFKNKKEFGSKLSIISHFKEYMALNEYKFNVNEYSRFVERGVEALNSYIKTMNPITDSRVEQYIGNCDIAGVPVKGILDLMEFETEVNVHLIDYKTGKYDKSKYQEGSTEDIGGEHWRQAMFYAALLFGQSKENWVPKSTSFIYIEPDEKGEDIKHTIEMNQNGLGLIRDQVKSVYNSIKNQDFSKGCGEETCQWCNLQKQINL